MIEDTIALTRRAVDAVLRGDPDALDIASEAARCAIRDVPFATLRESVEMVLLSGALHDLIGLDRDMRQNRYRESLN